MREIPKLQFAHLPTPIEPLPRLSAQLGGAKLFVKRDDQTGLAMGGNKTRKLEYLLADAQGNGAHTLITAGAAQSNHCRQTAAAAAHGGFDCILVLTAPAGGTVADAQNQLPSGNLLLDRLFGAELVWTDRESRDRVLEETYQRARYAGRRPYLIPYGGSNVIGATAYAFAMQELMQQTFQPDWIIFPSSSGGTQAGLCLGARLFGCHGQILGISVDEPAEILKQRVADLATRTADFLSEKQVFTQEDIQVNSDYLGGGYGILGKAEEEAIRSFARSEGLLLDPVYTARAAAGMIDLYGKGMFPPENTVLFWHTGGTPTLFADRYRQIAG
jgi:D-cysteine desulfhydrase family pyridoxal phosphate-dependent enzyme